MNVTVVPLSVYHAEKIKGKIREEDIREIYATNHGDAYTSVLYGAELSDPGWAVVTDSEDVVCCFGVTPYNKDEVNSLGVVWFIGTNLMDSIKLKIAKRSKAYIKKMMDKYNFIFNYVDERNQASVRWLKWCGFRFYGPVNYGIEQLPFYLFWKGEVINV